METHPTTEPDPEPASEAETDRRRRVPAPLAALGRAAGIAALVTAIGYAMYRWASTGMPLSPLPGSPWPYLTAWAVLTFLAGLLLQWATAKVEYDGRWQLLVLPAYAGIRLSLAHHPDPALIYAYGAATLAAGTAVTALWRRRLRRSGS
ncbi:hypothetical protein ABZW32_27575 [Streptomyces sp. NPDC004667]|uniref:hypothetical protein n=1 Tax=Streptomyces sp. NPDC004667 TaxID=3154285 RepID=UPI0033A49155